MLHLHSLFEGSHHAAWVRLTAGSQRHQACTGGEVVIRHLTLRERFLLSLILLFACLENHLRVLSVQEAIVTRRLQA